MYASTLLGAETWVALPEDRWPTHWIGKCHRPVVKLMLDLYGHADTGGLWESHYDEKLSSVGLMSCLWIGVGSGEYVSKLYTKPRLLARKTSVAAPAVLVPPTLVTTPTPTAPKAAPTSPPTIPQTFLGSAG